MNAHHAFNVGVALVLWLVGLAAFWGALRNGQRLARPWLHYGMAFLMFLLMCYGAWLLVRWGVPGLEP